MSRLHYEVLQIDTARCLTQTMHPAAVPTSHLDIAAWPLGTHLELAALPTAVPCARQHVRSVAHEWGLPELADTAELLASELVTNAVQASERLKTRADLAAIPVVRIWLASDRTSLAIHVWDGSSEHPVQHQAGPDEEHGRGLMLVEALGKDWGSCRTADGKVVWVLVCVDA
jgi:anti-sigma regulatory factor (Ser/Thr protein kinase)